MRNYYMIITTKQDFLCDVKNKFEFAGFPKRNKASVEKMKPGDKIVYYVSKESRFCAVVEVTGKSFVSFSQIWTDDFDLWEYRIPTQPIVFEKSYRSGVFIKDIWDNLEFIKNKNKWGSQVMGSYRTISENDYKIILQALKDKKSGEKQ